MGFPYQSARAPSVHATSCPNVASLRDVGFERGKITGLSTCCAISRTTGSVKAPDWPDVPINTVGCAFAMLIAERVQHETFEFAPADPLCVGAGARLPCRRTGDVVAPDIAHRPAAACAERLADDEMLGTTLLPMAGAIGVVGAARLADRTKPVLDLVPKTLVDNSQVRDLLDDPGRTVVPPGDALAGRRILEEPHPVPDQPPDVKLVAQNAGAALGMAADGRVAPGIAAWTGNPPLVEVLGDRDGGGVGLGRLGAL